MNINRKYETEKFRKKYRIKSARLKNWDYSHKGAYFLTICSKNKECFFGDIVDGKMQLSKIGKIVVEEWKKTSKVRENIELGEWIVMPNHLHGILIIYNDFNGKTENELLNRSKEYKGKHPQMSKISPTKNSISNAIKFFKRQTTIRSRKIDSKFAWQSRFYDHIIRNEKSYQTITGYIVHNPQRWQKDKLYIE